jgi:hypothetical protein
LWGHLWEFGTPINKLHVTKNKVVNLKSCCLEISWSEVPGTPRIG